MSQVGLGHRSHVETSAHVDLGTIGSGLRTTWAKTPGGIQHWYHGIMYLMYYMCIIMYTYGN